MSDGDERYVCMIDHQLNNLTFHELLQKDGKKFFRYLTMSAEKNFVWNNPGWI